MENLMDLISENSMLVLVRIFAEGVLVITWACNIVEEMKIDKGRDIVNDMMMLVCCIILCCFSVTDFINFLQGDL